MSIIAKIYNILQNFFVWFSYIDIIFCFSSTWNYIIFLIVLQNYSILYAVYPRTALPREWRPKTPLQVFAGLAVSPAKSGWSDITKEMQAPHQADAWQVSAFWLKRGRFGKKGTVKTSGIFRTRCLMLPDSGAGAASRFSVFASQEI